MAVVVFNYADWIEQYPAFDNKVTEAQALGFFNMATLRLSNAENGRVTDLGQRASLLYLLTAHIAQLSPNGGNTSGAVGKITSASEGSVSVSLDTGPSSASSWWYLQTPYGALYWELTASMRTMHYVPGPPAPGYNPYQTAYGYRRW